MLTDPILEGWLRDFLSRHEAASGTVHVVRDDALHLAAAVNIPAQVQQATTTIPMGKGMAGLAWERAQPVFTCNLQEDESGNIRPGAKAVGAAAAIAFPIGEPVRAIVGVAWMQEKPLDDASVAALERDAVADYPP
jgi:L-methionine (R)-S-oxide reductase